MIESRPLYDAHFFRLVDKEAHVASSLILPLLSSALDVKSVLDVGCGQGSWLQTWMRIGVSDVFGIDGVAFEAGVSLPSENFRSQDLNVSFSLGREFDLVQSLEVAEHLLPESAEILIENLTRHGKRILFSAARPGQGGYRHFNERNLNYWKTLFEKKGYVAFDWLRPQIKQIKEIAPWYRYNSLLFVHYSLEKNLLSTILSTRIEPGRRALDNAPLLWRFRCFCIGLLSVEASSRLSRFRNFFRRILE